MTDRPVTLRSIRDLLLRLRRVVPEAEYEDIDSAIRALSVFLAYSGPPDKTNNPRGYEMQ